MNKTSKSSKSPRSPRSPRSSRTMKNRANGNQQLLRNFQREITVEFFEIILMIKLYHWKTYSYSTHKATDSLYSNMNDNMDKFIEILLGKTGIRIDLTDKKNIRLYDFDNITDFVNKIKVFKNYLVELTNNKAVKIMSNTDLLNIRDEILGNLNQFLYLLSFK